jgi:hypothetical protein
MNVKSFEELGAWFTAEHAWNTPQNVVNASAVFLAHEFRALPWTVVFVDNQPYASAKEMRETVLRVGVLLISREGNSGPLSEVTVNVGRPHFMLDANLTFRAVHDSHHVKIHNAHFNFPGEARASAHMLRLIGEYGARQGWCLKLINEVKAFHFSEMMGQVSYFYNNGRQYLDEQYAVRYTDDVVADFEREWTQ